MDILSEAKPTMSAVEYFATSGLSHSGMKDLAVSHMRYWYLHVDPERPAIEPTPEMQFGTALHCAVLEPDEFDNRYACEPVQPPGCLVTIEDLRGWLRDAGITPKGTRKAEIVAQVIAACPADDPPPIWDIIAARHAEHNATKVIFKTDDWSRLAGCAKALSEEPRVQALLAVGCPEFPLFAADPLTGIPFKGKLDWVTPKVTLDVKTFTQKQKKSIDRSVADAIYYEEYYRQAYLYHTLRTLNGQGDTDFVLAFVESNPPHEVRIKSLRPKAGGQPNIYWTRAMLEVRALARTYKECMEHFGVEKPWRYAQEIELLTDEDMPQMAY